eukprot:SM000069S20658  [mRNA]  locus=s69:48858:50377:+ [translate_table: standard]
MGIQARPLLRAIEAAAERCRTLQQGGAMADDNVVLLMGRSERGAYGTGMPFENASGLAEDGATLPAVLDLVSRCHHQQCAPHLHQGGASDEKNLVRLEQEQVAIGAALSRANKHWAMAGLTMDSLRPSLTSHDAPLRHGAANAHPPLHLDLNLLHTQAVTAAWPSMVWLLPLVVERGKVALHARGPFPHPATAVKTPDNLPLAGCGSVITCAGCGRWIGHLDLGTLLGRDRYVVHDARLSRVQCRHLEQPQRLLHVLFSGGRRPGTRAGNMRACVSVDQTIIASLARVTLRCGRSCMRAMASLMRTMASSWRTVMGICATSPVSAACCRICCTPSAMHISGKHRCVASSWQVAEELPHLPDLDVAVLEEHSGCV